MNNDQIPVIQLNVWETDSTLKPLTIVYTTHSRDIAETVMMKMHKDSGLVRQFYIRDSISGKVISYLLTKATKELHGIP
jgi:hypothetical protein